MYGSRIVAADTTRIITMILSADHFIDADSTEEILSCLKFIKYFVERQR